ncbi:MAG: 1-acyl-sn-glycerol-3-phosphate acyltransferase [Acidimicrobiia bacterium]
MNDNSGTEMDPRPVRLRDRFILRIVRFAVPFLYENVETLDETKGRIPGGSPVLVVSNHFGGFADPLVLLSASPVVPRIVARDRIWRVPFAGWIMNWIGAIPVHKPKEQKEPVTNDQMFASCYDALEARLPLLIYPEGITREDPSIAPLKTGAARIALGARNAGTRGIHIVPVGIHYEDKSALRSRIFINAGEPIDLDASIGRYAPEGDPTPENRTAVRALTDEMEVCLRNVAPDFDDWQEAKSLTFAAEVTLRTEASEPTDEVPIADRDLLAAQLARSGGDEKATVMEVADDLERDLDGIGLSDREVAERMRTGSFFGYLLRSTLLLLVAVPIALIGLTVNLWPLLLVWATGFLPVGAAVKATIKPAGAILFFGISWGVAAWQGFERSIIAGMITLILLPVTLGALLYSSERVVRIYRSGRQWLKSRRVDALTKQIEEKRTAVASEVRDVVS